MKKIAMLFFIGLMFSLLLIAVITNLFSIGMPEEMKLKKEKKAMPEHRIKEVTFSGNIDPGYNYAVEVSYVATKDSRACTNYSLFYGKSKNVKYMHYRPIIEAGKHSITFPINELSPTSGCRWIPVLVNLCAGTKSNPEENNCNEFLNMRKSATTSKGIPLRSYNSSADKSIKVNCTEIKYDPGFWYCSRTEPPDADQPKSAYQKSSPLVLFSGMKGIEYPYDREDVYWFDIDFVPGAEQK